MKEPLFVKPLMIEDVPFLSGTGYGSMSEEAKQKMLSDSQAKRYSDGNYFEMFSLWDGTDVIGFVSLYSKEPGYVSIGLDIREQYRHQGYGTRSAEPIAELLAKKGFPAIRNTVRTDNEASVRLHKKLGFTLADQYTSEKGREVYVFEKAVSAMNPNSTLQNSIDAMTKAIVGVLLENSPSVYLYGSVALDDFRLGWSDIDLLVLTEKQISSEQAERFVHLRQELTGREPGNPYYRLFEGGMLRLSAFLTDTPDTVVYWGTSGERITDRYVFDSFCKKELLDNGVLLYGKDVRNQMRRPTYEDLKTDVRRHYETIREHGGKTGRSLYSFGWLLDISRCIYTLRTGKIIAKTKAGEWALENGLCPDAAALQIALQMRNAPHIFQKDETLQAYAATIGSAVQKYADVLERELEGLCK